MTRTITTTVLAIQLLFLPLVWAQATPEQVEPEAVSEFEPPREISWGIGKNYLLILGAVALSSFQGEQRVSLDFQVEYLVADRFGIRLATDIPVHSQGGKEVYEVFWDNLVHLLPYHVVDFYGGWGTGLSILDSPDDDQRVAPVFSFVGGLGIYPRLPFALVLEMRGAWSVDPLDGEDVWLYSGLVGGGIFF